MKNWIPEIAWTVFAIVLSFLLKGDQIVLLAWWMTAAVLGLTAMPLTGRLFRNFEDRGWMFSKVLGIVLTGFTVWWLVSVKAIKFTRVSCLLVCFVFLALSIVWILLEKKSIHFLTNVTDEKDRFFWFPAGNMHLIVKEELIFLVVFIIWTYLAGFNPQAYGTEKFMDYGFMEAMMRSPVLPARDLWYSEGHINYYYGGQYFAVFLTKISGTEVKETYNLMRMFVAALAFILPFSLVYQMSTDRIFGKKESIRTWIPTISGLTAGAAVSIAGNMHYVVYRIGKNVLEMLQGKEAFERSRYWFPDATRYIGFNPDVPDKTIHEFPCYSFVLGDLHAHVVNIMFVLLLLGLLYAWTGQRRAAGEDRSGGKEFVVKQFLDPHLLIVTLLLGMFQFTNYWDFVIYYVVCGGTVVFTNIICFRGKVSKIVLTTLLQAVEVFAVAGLVILPFTLQFVTMVDGVAFAKNHSLPHQLLILWGLPVILFTVFLISLSVEKIVKTKQKNLYTFMASINIPDLFAVVLGFCAIGLVLIPELVYVRDIYENGNARANTMFKLTYQAYIMFGIVMGYVIFRLLLVSRQAVYKAAAVIGAACLTLTLGYWGNSVNAWYGNVLNPGEYKGLDATAYIENTFWEDAGGIRWLSEQVTDVQVVLEANGDSYTDYARVSAMTGLPTILGWYVHEWLWRNNTDDLNHKAADIEAIYTSGDRTRVEELLKRYEVSYIFVGAKEREKYGERLNGDMLKSLGTIVYQDPVYDTYILQTGN